MASACSHSSRTPCSGELFEAAKGHGATCNGVPIQLRTSSGKIEDAIIGIGISKSIPAWNSIVPVAGLIAADATIRCRGSAALDLAYVAAGRLDGFVEKGLHLWDCAAGALLVSEAGGWFRWNVDLANPAQPFDVAAGSMSLQGLESFWSA